MINKPSKSRGPLQTTTIKGNVETTPPEFLAKRGLKITKQPVPLDVKPDDPKDALIESRTVQDQNTNERVKINTELTGSEDDALPFKVQLEDGQVGTGVRSLVNEGTDVTPTALTDTIQQKNLGNGKVDQTIITKPLPSVEKSYEVEIPDPIPEEFKVLAPVQTSEITQTGTAEAPSLAAGELTRRETQTTKFLKRVLIRARSLVSLPVSLTGSRLYEGIEAAVTRTLAAGDQTIDPDFKTISGEVRNTGAGTSVKEKVSVDEYPQKQGQVFDRQNNVVLPYTIDRKVMGDNIGDEKTEIEPVDFVKADVRVFNTDAVDEVLGNYLVSYPGRRIDIQWPSVLSMVEIIWQLSEGEGSVSENGAITGTGTPGTSINVNASTRAHSSKAAIPEVIFGIEHPYGEKMKTTEYFFFLKGSFDESDVLAKLPSVSDWPDFHPRDHYILLDGIKIAVEAEASARHSSSTSDSGTSEGTSVGGGSSFDVGPAIRAVTVGPVINDAIAFTSFGAVGFDIMTTVTAHANIDLSAISSGDFDPEADLHARVLPTSFPATDGDTSIPTGQDILIDVNVSRYELDWSAVRALVLHT